MWVAPSESAEANNSLQIEHNIPMKYRTLPLVLSILVVTITSCATTTTVNTSVLPDGTKVTTTVTARSSDPAAVQAAVQTAAILVPLVEDFAKKQ